MWLKISFTPHETKELAATLHSLSTFLQNRKCFCPLRYTFKILSIVETFGPICHQRVASRRQELPSLRKRQTSGAEAIVKKIAKNAGGLSRVIGVPLNAAPIEFLELKTIPHMNTHTILCKGGRQSIVLQSTALQRLLWFIIWPLWRKWCIWRDRDA